VHGRNKEYIHILLIKYESKKPDGKYIYTWIILKGAFPVLSSIIYG
jgi:hypothetical protein